MGTRNLTIVVQNGEYKVAQYGQFDGYPEGQGNTVLNFLKTADLDNFRNKVSQCYFGTNEQIDEAYKPYCSPEGWMTIEQSDAFQASEFGYLSRETAADILERIARSENGLMLHNSLNFAADSLFCEWAYLVDLDKNVLEVYKGFNKEALTENDRFVNVKCTDKWTVSQGYQPIRKINEFPIDNLPSREEFVAILSPDEDDDE